MDALRPPPRQTQRRTKRTLISTLDVNCSGLSVGKSSPPPANALRQRLLRWGPPGLTPGPVPGGLRYVRPRGLRALPRHAKVEAPSRSLCDGRLLPSTLRSRTVSAPAPWATKATGATWQPCRLAGIIRDSVMSKGMAPRGADLFLAQLKLRTVKRHPREPIRLNVTTEPRQSRPREPGLPLRTQACCACTQLPQVGTMCCVAKPLVDRPEGKKTWAMAADDAS